MTDLKCPSPQRRNAILSKTSWKDLAELLGIAAIVASLIFVGLQMKQSHEIALAAQYHARAEAVMSFHEARYEVGAIPNSPTLQAGLSDTVTPGNVTEVLWLWIAYDNHHFQYQAGFLFQDSKRRWVPWFCWGGDAS